MEAKGRHGYHTILLLGTLIMLAMAIFYYIHWKFQRLVGGIALTLPGADTRYYPGDNRTGDLVDYRIKGAQTDLQIEYDNLMLHGTMGDVKTMAEEQHKDLTMPMFRDTTKDVYYRPFTSGGISGYYELRLVDAHGPVGEQRNLFFLKDERPYTLRFCFTRSTSASDNAMIAKNWKSVLNQIGIAPSALPLAR